MDDERLIEIERLHAAVHLARGCFHQFGNMLTLIGGYGSLVKDSLEPGSEDAELMGRIGQAVKQASLLLDDTHRFVRGKPVAEERMDVCSVAREVSDLVESTYPRIKVPTRTPEGPVHVTGSPRRLFDALMHVVLNALEAQDGKGEIHLEVESGDGRVTLAVTDEGPGIAADEIAKALEPGFTTRDGGDLFSTGLGLPAARAIARQMKGALELEPGDGGGLRVCLRLPEEGSRA
jgi:signal transduction histidine kinase